MLCKNIGKTASKALILFAFLASSQVAAAPPVEAFGHLPMVKWMQVSPNGQHYAAVQVRGGRDVLAIYDQLDPQSAPRILDLDRFRREEERLEYFRWVNDDRLVVSISIPSIREKVPTRDTKLLSVSRDLSEERWIPKVKRIRVKETFRGNFIFAQIQDRVINWLPQEPNHVLMLYNLDGLGHEYSAYKVNVVTGATRLYERGGKYLIDYRADQNGEVRYKFEITQRDTYVASARVSKRTPWIALYERTADEPAPITPVGFTNEREILFAAAIDKSDRQELFRMDFVERKLVSKDFSHPRVDFGEVLRDPITQVITGYTFTDEMPQDVYWDEELAALQAQLEGVFAGDIVSLTSHDRARENFIVFVSGPRRAGDFYHYARLTNQLKLMGQAYPSLRTEDLSDMKGVIYAARDGISIPGFITRPKGPGPFPLVVMPHGGPTARSRLEFDYWAQFFASRGYAVLQPNFRGSLGYGRNFLNAGHKQWGLAMQDDITDGVRAMVARGIADPDRVCIVGGSYGGYAALMGVVKTPDLYKCAISFAGISDVRKLVSDWSIYRFRDRNLPNIGSLWNDGQRLRDTSPINQVEKIKAPILLVHGIDDRRVPVSHSENMARALARAGKPHRLVLQKGGDHRLSLEEHRVQFLREAEAFLAEHLK